MKYLRRLPGLRRDGAYRPAGPDDAVRTKSLVAAQETDRERWTERTSFDPDWAIRARAAVAWIPDGTRVLDIGAGQQALRDLLPRSCRYTPADLKQWSSDTILIDLNEGLWPEGDWDVVVALGVLEYVYDPYRYFAGVAHLSPRLVMSYCFPAHQDEGTIQARRNRAWLTDFSVDDIERAASAVGFSQVRSRPLNQEVDFVQVLLEYELATSPGGRVPA